MPDAPLNRPTCQGQRHRQCAQCRRRTQETQAPGTHVQDVAREHGQQRNGAAQQHGKKIERDGAQHNFVLPHVVHPGQQTFPAQFIADGQGQVTYRCTQHAPGGKECSASAVHPARTSDVQRTTDGRAGNHRPLPTR